jgi:hypothetical protein
MPPSADADDDAADAMMTLILPSLLRDECRYATMFRRFTSAIYATLITPLFSPLLPFSPTPPPAMPSLRHYFATSRRYAFMPRRQRHLRAY